MLELLWQWFLDVIDYHPNCPNGSDGDHNRDLRGDCGIGRRP